MTLPLSLHARQRMSERSISATEVHECLRIGRPLSAEPGQQRLFHHNLVVVHNGQVVITVYRRACLLKKLVAGLRWSLADTLRAALEVDRPPSAC